jgi:serine/threonine-protein kinase
VLDLTDLVVTDRDALVGETLDRYAIVELLGSGGMGRVYRARHTAIEREYAIKVLYGDLLIDTTFKARFQREAQTISRIRHPNVVSVSDFGITESGLLFIVMELLLGRTLARLIDKGSPLLPSRAAHIARQIALALEAAHAAGYVHRDVKPTNVMLSGRPPDETVKVLDFGTVGLVQQRFDDRLTTVGQLIGTPAFMAPEQFEGPSSVGPEADLYALGVVLYNMLAGRIPFSGANPTELMVQHMTGKPLPLPPSGGLEVIAARLLEKKPEDRPKSAREVIRQIDALRFQPEADFSEMPSAETGPVMVFPSSESRGAAGDRHARPVRTRDEDEEGDTTIPDDDRETRPTGIADLDSPTLVPAPDLDELLAPDGPTSAEVIDDTRTVPDTAADLLAPELPGVPPPAVESATTRLLSPEPPPPTQPRTDPTRWIAVAVIGLGCLIATILIFLLR